MSLHILVGRNYSPASIRGLGVIFWEDRGHMKRDVEKNKKTGFKSKFTYAVILSLVITTHSPPLLGNNTRFIDLADYLIQNSQQERLQNYHFLLDVLRGDFDYICPDTFCEGRYENLRLLEIACSVSTRGDMMNCAWIVAGANFILLNENGGFVVTNHDIFTCSTRMAGKKAYEFVDKLSQFETRAMFEEIVDGKSLYDLLSECL